MDVVLHSTNCPKCKVLEKKLTEKQIKYKVNTSVEDMLKLGIKSAPVLQVDSDFLQFPQAVSWVNNQ